jgi:hypothetical protein
MTTKTLFHASADDFKTILDSQTADCVRQTPIKNPRECRGFSSVLEGKLSLTNLKASDFILGVMG